MLLARDAAGAHMVNWCRHAHLLHAHALQAGASVIPTTALMLCSYASQLLTAVVSTITYTLWWVLLAVHAPRSLGMLSVADATSMHAGLGSSWASQRA
jgi:hypothetical protein